LITILSLGDPQSSLPRGGMHENLSKLEQTMALPF
jgi:hypothetical protein